MAQYPTPACSISFIFHFLLSSRFPGYLGGLVLAELAVKRVINDAARSAVS